MFAESDKDVALVGVQSYKAALRLVICTLFGPRNCLSFRVEPRIPRIPRISCESVLDWAKGEKP